jgi:hypothetical protein
LNLHLITASASNDFTSEAQGMEMPRAFRSPLDLPALALGSLCLCGELKQLKSNSID